MCEWVNESASTRKRKEEKGHGREKRGGDKPVEKEKQGKEGGKKMETGERTGAGETRGEGGRVVG